jgi:hypothetical protein
MLAGSTLIYRKLSSPPQALRSSTTRAARHKWEKKKKKKKNRSRIYDLGVVPTRGKNSNWIQDIIYLFIAIVIEI